MGCQPANLGHNAVSMKSQPPLRLATFCVEASHALQGVVVDKLKESVNKKDAIINELLAHIKKVDPSGYPIVYQRLIDGRPLHMQKRLRAR